MNDIGFDMDAAMNGMQRRVASPDDGLHIEFYTEEIKDEVATLAEGSPKFKSIEYVKIKPIGDPTQVNIIKVTDRERTRFERQYKLWKLKGEDAIDGFPLKQWSLLTKAEVMEFAESGIKSIEQLANIPDSRIQSVGLQARKWRQRAQDFLAESKGSGLVHQLRNENENFKKDLEILKQTVEALKAHNEAMLRGMSMGGYQPQHPISAGFQPPYQAPQIQIQTPTPVVAPQVLEQPIPIVPVAKPRGRPKKTV